MLKGCDELFSSVAKTDINCKLLILVVMVLLQMLIFLEKILKTLFFNIFLLFPAGVDFTNGLSYYCACRT